MTTGTILGAITAVCMVVLAIMKAIGSQKSAERKTAEALAKVEADETDKALAAVDADYQRVRDSGK